MPDPTVGQSETSGQAAVLVELARVTAKCERLRKEIRAMHEKFDDGEIASLRAQIEAYRRALSAIIYRLDQDPAGDFAEISGAALRSIAVSGLACRNLRPRRSKLARGQEFTHS